MEYNRHCACFETMKVKQLRNWLSDVGEKQKHHRARSEGRSLASTDKLCFQASLTIERKGSIAETSPTSSRDHISPRTQMDDLEAGFSPPSFVAECTERRSVKSIPSMDGVNKVCAKCGADTGSQSKLTASDSCVKVALSLKQNPSTDPTVATGDDCSAATSNDNRQQKASWVTTLVNGGSWNNVDFSDPALIVDFNPSTSFEVNNEIDSEETKGPAPGRREDYYDMKMSNGGIQEYHDMGQLHHSLLRKKSPILSPVEQDEETGQTRNEASTVHIMPSRMHSANIFGNKTLTAGTLDFICGDGNVNTGHQSLPRWIVDDETGSSWSNDSTSHPAIIPGALDSKMAQLLLDPHPINEATRKHAGYQRASYPIPRRKKIDPSDLEFLNRKGPTFPVESVISQQGRRVSETQGIRKFGEPKKTIVERRKEELERLWADNKEEIIVKKVKWGVCKSTGMYKKKIVIDVQRK